MSSQHWTHPQVIPRGFLRVYILTTLSRAPATGYEIMQGIEERTEGAWRPGPGTIYPLLKSLVREKLVLASRKFSKTSKISYTITPKGQDTVANMRSGITSFGRKERFIMRLASELIPSQMLVPLLLNRARESAEFLRSKIAELPEPERTAALRELGTSAENQLDWVNATLETRASAKPHRRHTRQP